MRIEDNKIIFDDSKTFECIYPIKDHVVYENDIVIVMLDVPMNIRYDANVLAFNSEGEIWQIEEQFKKDDCFFNMMKIDENNLLHLYNWCGFVFKLDPLTGTVLDRIFTK
jgi:ADP-glucose pyrophosphorylase